MAAILGEGKFFLNCQEYNAQTPVGRKILMKSLYLARLRRWKQISVLPFLAKIRKFKMAAILGEGKFFLNCQEYNAQTPVGRKF